MNATTILGRGGVATAILVWCVLFLCLPGAFPNDQPPSAELRCDARSQVGDVTVVQFRLRDVEGVPVHLRGVPDTGPPILLTPAAGERRFSSPGEVQRSRTYLYAPTAPGVIDWRLRIGDDEVSCRTSVLVAKSDDEREEEEEHDGGGTGGGGTDPRVNFIALHNRASERYDSHCNDCHREVHSRESLDLSILPAHRVMAPFAMGRAGSDRQCRSCHSTVDLTSGRQRAENSTGNLRRHVDVALCTLCHGPRPGGASKKFYQANILSPTDPDGPRLYNVVCSGCHRPLENSQVRGKSARDIQKKINENEGGMGPLRVLTQTEIEAIAAALDR